jgi:hypothetical protein
VALGGQDGSDFADDIASAATPWGVPDAMLGKLGWPQAEAIVVLGSQDEQPDAGLLKDGGPLFRIKVGGICLAAYGPAGR